VRSANSGPVPFVCCAAIRRRILSLEANGSRHRSGMDLSCHHMGSLEVSAELETLIRGLVDGSVPPYETAPAVPLPWLNNLLSKADTYRDAALMVLAFAVDAGSTAGIGIPPDGRRSVAQRFATLCDELNISARRDAFQTIAKGSETLFGRERQSWNLLLEWGRDEASLPEIEEALRYMATRIASTARDLPPMPELDVSRLTFRRVVGAIDEILSRPSGGAHEQFVFAALLHGLAQEYGNRRVETKVLNAADASAGTAADVQVLEGGRVTEAYEVTANHWRSKIAQAAATLQLYDLPRIHIVASGANPSAGEIADAVASAALPSGVIAQNVDLSVLDLGAQCRSLVHTLSRPGRRTALQKLWEHLASRQPNDSLVVAYVECLQESGMTVT